jgi:hypothetical protein
VGYIAVLSKQGVGEDRAPFMKTTRFYADTPIRSAAADPLVLPLQHALTSIPLFLICWKIKNSGPPCDEGVSTAPTDKK